MQGRSARKIPLEAGRTLIAAKTSLWAAPLIFSLYYSICPLANHLGCGKNVVYYYPLSGAVFPYSPNMTHFGRLYYKQFWALIRA